MQPIIRELRLKIWFLRHRGHRLASLHDLLPEPPPTGQRRPNFRLGRQALNPPGLPPAEPVGLRRDRPDYVGEDRAGGYAVGERGGGLGGDYVHVHGGV